MLLAIKSNPQSSRNSHSEETSKGKDFSVVTTKEMISKIHIAKNYGTNKEMINIFPTSYQTGSCILSSSEGLKMK